MNKKALIIGIGVLVVIGITSFFILKKKKSKSDVIFDVLLLGGLDYRTNDLDIEEQKALLQKGLGDKIKVKSFRYNNSNGLINEMKSNKNVKIVLFSKGCDYSSIIAEEMQKNQINLNRLYIVEPYALSINTKTSVQKAVSLGVPNKNVIVGTSEAVGKGIIENATNTPNCSPYHWCALEMIGQIIKQ